MRDDPRDIGIAPTEPLEPISRASEAQREAGNDATAAPTSRKSRRRYQVIDGHVTCGNAANIHLWVKYGLTVDEAGRRKYPYQTIFLDGVYTGSPFYDNELRQYSLDHHSGCVRAFTLATCEQAAVMLSQGLPLAEGNWAVYINDPDLDALVAAWLLMNHLELLREDAQLLWHVMPFVRVEGVIDAHGLDMAVVSGLARETYQQQMLELNRLKASENQARATTAWTTSDLAAYAAAVLEELDTLLFPASHLDSLLELAELGRVTLGDGTMVFLCSSQLGVYAVESQLKARYGNKLALIVLDMGEGRFTLRQSNSFLRKDLRELYPVLNQRDLRARQENETGNLWGGSGEIGGSPRKTGTALSGQEILDAIQEVYGRQGWLKRVWGKLK
jgi:hypothetical protein